jgi:hypothetical protein
LSTFFLEFLSLAFRFANCRLDLLIKNQTRPVVQS